MEGNHGYDDDNYINRISINLTDNIYRSQAAIPILDTKYSAIRLEIDRTKKAEWSLFKPWIEQ